MALGAHKIPILVEPGPVQNVVVFDLFVRIEVEPTLSAFMLWPTVPGDGKRLQASIGKLNQVLLKRIDAEGKFHLEGRQLAVRSVGLDEALSVLAEERSEERR